MKKPDCKTAIFALVFGIIGGGFLIAGLVLLYLRAGGVTGLILFEAGVLLLMAFGGCLMYADLLHRQWDKLRWKGTSVEARVEEVTHHTNISWSRLGIRLSPSPQVGGASPWSVLCRYQWKGKEYTVRSALLWTKPCPAGPVTVRIDPSHPQRAWVDVDSLRMEAL